MTEPADDADERARHRAWNRRYDETVSAKMRLLDDEETKAQTLTYDETKQYLLRAVNEKGADYIYEEPWWMCQYFEGADRPSCIVGHVLHYKGITRDDLTSTGSNDTAVFELPEYLDNFEIDERALLVLDIVQLLQDVQVPWGPALAVAITAVEEEGTHVDVAETVGSFLDHYLS